MRRTEPPVLRVMVGGPGCGKTTYCERRAAAGRFGARLSLDRERAVLGRHERDQDATPAAVAMVHAIAGALLAGGREVTIDATATTAAERGTWLALARRHGAVPVAVIVRAPLAVALARNAARARPVPEPVVRELWYRVYALTLPGLLAEGFRAVTEVDTTPTTRGGLLMYTVTDLFWGRGPSALGAVAVPSVQLVMAANHWERAVATHAANFPSVAPTTAPTSARLTPADTHGPCVVGDPGVHEPLLAQGRAGRKRNVAPPPNLFGEVLCPDAAADRTRATMWDVPSYTEVYARSVIVENVVDAVKWARLPAWLARDGPPRLPPPGGVAELDARPGRRCTRPADPRPVLCGVLARGNPAPDLASGPRRCAWCVG